MKKLIVPNEAKVCATCSYWGGNRKVDGEFGVVVVAENGTGECLVQEIKCLAFEGTHRYHDCAWEELALDSLQGIRSGEGLQLA
ncbi:MAG: hypothetical protein FWD77_02715 [Betaproteobacteria bacterium]|nr:hypothetical protein [Betaproteobacteria bacterium]